MSVNIIGTTAILLNRITLLAVVGGNEVTNPFMVTEVYVQQDGSWKLASLSFTRLLTPERQPLTKIKEKMMQTVKLNNGVEMPILGFGVFQITDADRMRTERLRSHPDRISPD